MASSGSTKNVSAGFTVVRLALLPMGENLAFAEKPSIFSSDYIYIYTLYYLTSIFLLISAFPEGNLNEFILKTTNFRYKFVAALDHYGFCQSNHRST